MLEGLGGLAPAIPLILMAASIRYIVDSGGITDTILHAAAQPFVNLNPIAGALVVYVLALGIEFLIASGSAKAFLMMPIICPLADIIGVTRQTAVLALLLRRWFLQPGLSHQPRPDHLPGFDRRQLPQVAPLDGETLVLGHFGDGRVSRDCRADWIWTFLAERSLDGLFPRLLCRIPCLVLTEQSSSCAPNGRFCSPDSHTLSNHPDLSIDWLWAEPHKKEHLVLVSTAEHGIEGYVGTAMLKIFIEEFAPLPRSRNHRAAARPRHQSLGHATQL